MTPLPLSRMAVEELGDELARRASANTDCVPVLNELASRGQTAWRRGESLQPYTDAVRRLMGDEAA